MMSAFDSSGDGELLESVPVIVSLGESAIMVGGRMNLSDVQLEFGGNATNTAKTTSTLASSNG